MPICDTHIQAHTHTRTHTHTHTHTHTQEGEGEGEDVEVVLAFLEGLVQQADPAFLEGDSTDIDCSSS